MQILHEFINLSFEPTPQDKNATIRIAQIGRYTQEKVVPRYRHEQLPSF
jgi:hypothetical protein